MARTPRRKTPAVESGTDETRQALAQGAPGESAAQQVMEGFAGAYRAWLEAVGEKPQEMMALQNRYMQEQMRLWMEAVQPRPEAAPGAAPAAPGDKRFSAAEWESLPVFRYLRDSYLLTSKTMMQAVEETSLREEDKQRMRFFMRQYLDAMAPSNYLMTNPEALKAALESGGETLQEGMKNLLADMEKGRIAMTDETAFEVGKNIAVSPGAVVWENELIQLIQYQPLTAKVFERPLVMVPPCINKFYIMDLQPENSLVRFAVSEGHTTFMCSWRNVNETHSKVTWDDYLEALIEALAEVQRITKAPKVNALAFCIGGTLLTSALAVLDRKGVKPVESLTLLTTLLDFRDVGEIRVYIDKNFVEKREKQLAKGGIVPGNELAGAFSSLRANDLVWSYVVSKYLKGKQPPAFDLLYWNADATNLPGPMYSYYLRNTYEDNKLCKPDALEMLGEKVSLKRLKMPTFVFAAREDHIVPWKGGYDSARALGGKVTFVLGASGHIAGTINPASKNKRSHWINDKVAADADKWLAAAKEVPGSWWSAWAKWVKPYGGKLVAVPKKLGDGRKKPIEPAPGRYAKERL